MSAVVRMRSSWSRSSDCTTAAKFSMVLRSERSRDWAMVDITRWFSTSHAAVSVSAGKVARLGDGRHHQVVFHEPCGGLGLGRRKTEARTQAARDARAGDRVVLDPALGK